MLEELPKLARWYQQGYVQKPTQTHEIFLWNLLRGLITPGKESVRYWIQGVDLFLRGSSDNLEDFLLADSLSQELGKPVTEILGTLCEVAIRSGEGAKAFGAAQHLAAKTNLCALRFLAAWVAFNLGDLETCIEECEKEREAYAPIHTLLGQALLESGRTKEAIDALNVAKKLDAHDILPLFQLVKAYMVDGQLDKATETVKQCRTLTGDHIEVECLSALIVVSDKGQNRPFAEETSQRLFNLFMEDSGNLDLLCLTFDVQEVQADQRGIKKLFDDANFSELTKNHQFKERMVVILRKLGDHGWFSLSKQLTERILESDGSGTKSMNLQ